MFFKKRTTCGGYFYFILERTVENLKTINELIMEYRKDAKRIRDRIAFLNRQMKEDSDRNKMQEYRRRIELLYEEHGDIMYAIQLMLPHMEEERRMCANGDC